MAAVLVDLGGTHLRFALWRDAGPAPVLQRSRILNFTSGIGVYDIWERIIDAIADFTASARHAIPPDAPIIFSFPGPIDRRSQALDAPTVAGRTDTVPDIQSTLALRTGREVHILNDLSAAAWHFSRTVAASRFMVIAVSSGIGSKIFDRNHLHGVIDDVPFAGEIGHVTVDETPDAPICDCGGHGHLGAIASGRGIERRARDVFGSGTITNEQTIAPAARAGDTRMLELIRECTRPLARVLLQTIIAAGVETIVVIGGFALSLGEVYRSILQQEITRQCDYRVAASRIDNLITLGDDDACLLGTAAFAARFL